MNAELRREYILAELNQQNKPISASALASMLGVSRQIIVGDVALLRAQGQNIVATARGYIVADLNSANQYLGKVASQHSPEDTSDELYTIVDLNAVIINVIVEHEVYGEITGGLNLASRSDVYAFMSKVKSSKVKLLSELTMGVHLHTIACRDKTHFEEVYQELKSKGYLFQDGC